MTMRSAFQAEVEKYLKGNYDDVDDARARRLTETHIDFVTKGETFRSNATYVADEIAKAEGGLVYHGRLDEADDEALDNDDDD